MLAKNRNRYLWEFLLLGISVLIFVSSFLINFSRKQDISLGQQTTFFEKQIDERVQDYENLIQQAGLMERLTQSRETLGDLIRISNPPKPFYFYLYKKDSGMEFLRFWNTGIVIPTDSILNSDKDEQMLRLDNGYYYSLRRSVPNHPEFVTYCLILVKSSFFVETEYFKSSFPFDRKMDEILDITFEPNEFPVTTKDGQPLFYLKYKPNIQLKKDSEISVLFKIVGLFLFFFAFYLILAKRFAQEDYRKQIWLLLGCLLLFRAACYGMAYLWNFSEFRLFNPQLYSSGFLLPTLGDLLINSVLFCWVGVFVWNRLSVSPFDVAKYPKNIILITGASCLVLLISTTYSIASVIKSLIEKSNISFDVTNIESLSAFTIVGFIILACLCLGFFYFSRTLYKYVFSAFRENIWSVFLWTAVLGLLSITIFVKKDAVLFYLPVLIWLLVYTLIFAKEDVITRAIKFSVSGTVLWIFIFSISISLLMLREINKAELALRKSYIEKLATQTDPSSERLISIANKYLDTSYFRKNFHRLYDERENSYMRDSIRERNYIGYLNKYVTNIYFFDSLNRPMYNAAPRTLEELNNIVFRQSKPTSLQDMYFYEDDYDKYAYITRRVIKKANSDDLIGTVYIVSNPKKFGGAKIAPELFKQYSQNAFDNSSIYQYAIYQNNQLASSSISKKYPFTSTLTEDQLPKKRFDYRQRPGYSEVWYRASATKTIVVVRKSEVLLEAITLFSYIFCSFLLLVAIINVFMILLGTFMGRKLLGVSAFFPTIKSQIHGTFILINILAFVVVGAATISFFIKRFEDSNNERLSRTMNIMINELNSHDSLRVLLNENRFNNDLFANNALTQVIKRVSDIHGLDVNVYDFTGELMATSQTDVYGKGVLSKRMMPRAFYNLLRLRRVQYTQQERVSELSYTVIYAPVGTGTAQPYAYLSIPYFTSQQELNQEISSFLITLINLYAFIFLLTGLLALLITNRITNSFTVIGDKMKQISLSKANEEIVWERDDEIGQLVTEYNKMVSQLQESANKLARSEREEAWREMARQVAHEIKNPLTPMKLSLQYLQKAIDEKSPNIQQLTSSLADTLVEQIDYLSKIAADFSQFANINHTKVQDFDLHEVIKPLISIYSKNPKVDLIWKPLPGKVIITADKLQMNRLFTNLLVNAIDACDGCSECIIHVNECTEEGNLIISIKDSGSGISEEMQPRIFTPNFTTKSSGTGLGLAMCRGIVEKANGSIWFETVPNKGTTFFVKLPLID